MLVTLYQTHGDEQPPRECANVHLVVEDLALAGLGLGDEAVVEDVEDILADVLELGLDLLAVLADDADVLIRALGLLFLLDAGDDSPRSATRPDHVLVGHGEQVTLVNGKLAADLVCLRQCCASRRRVWRGRLLSRDRRRGGLAAVPYLRDFLITCQQ